jgi:transcriptional regulator with XRE-family HTH domain
LYMNRARLTAADRLIAMRIRECRIGCGLTQRQFAERIGVTFQQVHRYESGFNSVSVARLYSIARELGAPLESFFEGLEQSERRSPSPRQRMLLRIVHNFGDIQNERHQKAFVDFTRALAGR